MDNTTKRPLWMEDELVKNISTEKLVFLEKMYQESQGKSKKDMIAFLMPMMKKAKEQNLSFTPAEMNAAIAAIKKYSTQEEIAKMDQLLEKAAKKAGGN